METRSWVVRHARDVFSREFHGLRPDCRSQSALSARTALSAARRRFRPRVRSARAARTAKALGVPRRASDRTPQLRREPRAGSSRRDDASKMSTNSFHASAGARLESSTPRSDNPFTSGEEEVRRDGDVRSRRNARDSDGTGPAIGTRARRRVSAKRYAQEPSRGRNRREFLLRRRRRFRIRRLARRDAKTFYAADTSVTRPESKTRSNPFKRSTPSARTTGSRTSRPRCRKCAWGMTRSRATPSPNHRR